VAADVGTGSGAVAIALARGAPGLRVWAADTSRHAVALARRNVGRHGLRRRSTSAAATCSGPRRRRWTSSWPTSPTCPSRRWTCTATSTASPERRCSRRGDGLGAYRRLVQAARGRLTCDGLLLIQVRRRVLAARRDELDALAASLCPGVAPAA
jgi:release factor glutamine methyltransferase